MARREQPKRHRVTILGTGVMGRRHVRVFSGLHTRFDLVGVFDTNQGVGQEVAESARVRCFAREAEAIAAAELVVVASPIAAHAPQVRRALGAGCSVLVEKPFCGRAADAHTLATSPGAGQHLFVGHSERYNPVVVALRALVTSRDVLALDLRRIAQPPTRSREHSVVLSLAVHDLDLAAYLTGGGIDLRSASGAGADRAELVVACDSGAVARLWVDRTSRVRERRIVVTTSTDILVGDLLVPRLVRTARLTGISNVLPVGDIEPLAAQALAVADALDGRGVNDLATGVDGAQTLAVAERAIRWIEDGARERVPAAS